MGADDVPMVCRPGARVRILGLRARPDLNDQEAVVLSEQKERWAVRCTLSNECVKVKPVNLVFCEARLTELEDDVLQLVFSFAYPGALRNAAASSRKLRSRCSSLLSSAAYRRRCDVAQLARWKASSPVFGFFSFDTKRDPSPRWGPNFEGHLDCCGSRIVHVDSFGRACLYENGSEGACEHLRTVSTPSGNRLMFHQVALSSAGRLAASLPVAPGKVPVCLYSADGAFELQLWPGGMVPGLAWTAADTLVLIGDHGKLWRWASGMGQRLEAFTTDDRLYEVLSAVEGAAVVAGSSDGMISVWAKGTSTSFASGFAVPDPQTEPEPDGTFLAMALSAAARRVVSLSRDAAAHVGRDGANQIRVHEVATGVCVGSVAYRDEISRMPWFAGSFQFVWPADEAEEHEEDDEQLHSLTCCAMRGESMLVTGDDSGCICVWDVGAGNVEGGSIRRIAALPPPDAESPEEHLIKSIAILDPAGGVDGLAGGSVLYSKRGGRLEKMVPIDKGELSWLTEQVEWQTDEVPAGLRHDHLAELGELEGALAGLSALGGSDDIETVNDEAEAAVPPPPAPPPPPPL